MSAPVGYVVIDNDGTFCADQVFTRTEAEACIADLIDEDINGIYGPYRVCAVIPVEGEP